MTKDNHKKIIEFYIKLDATKPAIYKNFKELCNAIGIDYVSSDSKKAILKTLDNYCLIEHTKKSHSYTITKRDEFSIKPSIKQKRDRKSEYAKTMYPIFLSLLKNKDSLVLQSYRNQLFISFGFSKTNLFQYHTKKKSDEMILDEFKQNCYGIIIQPFTRAINNLIKNNIIIYRERYKVSDINNISKEWRLANVFDTRDKKNEQTIIEESIRMALHNLHCKNIYEVFIKKKKADFYEELNNSIQLVYPTIEYKAIIYELIFNKAMEIEDMYIEYNNVFGKMTDDEIEKEIERLRKIINNRILATVQKNNDRDIQDFIFQITEKKKEIFEQLKEDYGEEMTLEDCTKIYKSLLEEFTNNIIKID